MRKKTLLTLLFALLPALLADQTVQSREVTEYSVKAAYLFNFAKFVQWPASAFQNEKSPVVIGVLGEDPFGKDLDEAVRGKSVDGRPIEIKRFTSLGVSRSSQLKKCQILFVAYSEKSRLRATLSELRESSILTVSEIENFPLLGGMVLFDRVGKKINLVINPEAAKKVRLEISAKLLQVAKIYKAE